MALNYFVYKVGAGNCWLPIADDHGFYVGFDDGDSGDPPPIGVRDPEREFSPTMGGDEDNIAWLTHPENGKNNLIIVYDAHHMHFYEVTGRVVRHPIGSAAFLAALGHAEKHPTIAKHDHYRGKFGNKDGPPEGSVFKTMPVKKVASIRRPSLYTSVDSLSVYQGLNRGTCRRLWRATGPTNGGMPPELMDKVQGRRGSSAPRIPHWSTKGDTGVEKPFAAFVRLYLNDLLANHEGTTDEWREKATTEPRLSTLLTEVGQNGLRQMALATFNPILVETAAFYFCLDLGLLPDVGIGKGFEHVDVRARAEPGCDIGEVLSKLDAIPTLSVSDATRRRIQAGVLDLQCKAADKAGVADHLIYFGYRSQTGDGSATGNTIHLPDLLRHIEDGGWTGSHLLRFIKMQERVLSSVVRP